MTAGHAGSSPVCSRCGRPQPATGDLRTSDGTPINAATYLALAGLVGDALVCADCLSTSGADGGDPFSAPPAEVRPGRHGYTETRLDERACRRLLPTQPIGRLAFTENALPVVVPAHFVVRGSEVILAGLTDDGLQSARREDVVAFGVDAYDAATRQGWWVSALGRARLITETTRIRELDGLDSTPEAGNPHHTYIAIRIDRLRGRRMMPTAQPQR